MKNVISDLNEVDNQHTKLVLQNIINSCKDSLFKDIINYTLTSDFKEAYLCEISMPETQMFFANKEEDDICFIQCGFDIWVGFDDVALITVICQTEFNPTEETISKYRIYYNDSVGDIADSFSFINHEEANKFIANIIVNGDVVSKEKFNIEEISYEHYESQREYLINLAKSYL